jgi:hypothetical protein
VDSKGGSGMLPGGYDLVTQYPRRVFSPEQAAAAGAEPPTLQAAGLMGPREVLFLEQRHEQQPGQQQQQQQQQQQGSGGGAS